MDHDSRIQAAITDLESQDRVVVGRNGIPYAE
jgi:hypothetical protein